jgi:hypothetical protein
MGFTHKVDGSTKPATWKLLDDKGNTVLSGLLREEIEDICLGGPHTIGRISYYPGYIVAKYRKQ